MSTNQGKVDDELKNLALEYIKAFGAKDYTGAELILHDINKLKSLVYDDKSKNTK
jgi:D-alanine-D-alanine ligase-like ATP-grasp enzyme|tara:strand:- start:570 stop:734 length:165 start_codon:yes stop_codon:yes gene_type:complete